MLTTLLFLIMLNQAGLSDAQSISHVDGIASFYSNKECSGRTASGEMFDDTKYTCATWLGSFYDKCLIVSDTGKFVVCKINDRGPSKKYKTRIIDLSKAAMKQLDGIEKGLVNVHVIYFNTGDK